MKNSLICLYDPMGEIETVEEFLKFFNLSKSFLKKEVPKKYLFKKIRHKDELNFSLNTLNSGFIHPVYNGPPIKVLLENEDILAISKPHKIHSHPLSYLESDNCMSYLRQMNFLSVLNINKSSYDRGMLYRLDYDTSGVLLFSKNKKQYEDIRKNFHDKAKEKYYLAIVSNRISRSDTLKHRITTTGKVVKESSDGVEAKIEFEKVASNEKYSLIKIKLGHGHRHQIRVQLQLNGTPILGDSLYGGEDSSRLWLHAYSYKISVDDGRVIEVKDIPESFFSFLNLDCNL